MERHSFRSRLSDEGPWQLKSSSLARLSRPAVEEPPTKAVRSKSSRFELRSDDEEGSFEHEASSDDGADSNGEYEDDDAENVRYHDPEHDVNLPSLQQTRDIQNPTSITMPVKKQIHYTISRTADWLPGASSFGVDDGSASSPNDNATLAALDQLRSTQIEALTRIAGLGISEDSMDNTGRLTAIARMTPPPPLSVYAQGGMHDPLRLRRRQDIFGQLPWHRSEPLARTDEYARTQEAKIKRLEKLLIELEADVEEKDALIRGLQETVRSLSGAKARKKQDDSA